jgi:hypothetical protein
LEDRKLEFLSGALLVWGKTYTEHDYKKHICLLRSQFHIHPVKHDMPNLSSDGRGILIVIVIFLSVPCCSFLLKASATS